MPHEVVVTGATPSFQSINAVFIASAVARFAIRALRAKGQLHLLVSLPRRAPPSVVAAAIVACAVRCAGIATTEMLNEE